MTAETPPTARPASQPGVPADDGAVRLDLRLSRSAVLPGVRVVVGWETRNAYAVRIAGPDGYGFDIDASAGRGITEVVVHHTGEISAVAFGYDGRWARATRPVMAAPPPRVIEFPEIDLSSIFVPSYQRLSIPLVARTRQSDALLGAARPEVVRGQLGRPVRRWTPADRTSPLVPPPSLFTVTPVRSTWRVRNADPGPTPRQPLRARALAALFSTFVGTALRRERRPRGSRKP